jgi:osmotically inducible protein OsmC
MEGSGQVTLQSSGLGTYDVTWASRANEPEGRTSPEELIAAAHAACFSMALSNGLAKSGSVAERLDVSADVTFEKTDAGWRVVSSALTVVGSVPGISAADFAAAADAAKDGCPVSNALKGNVSLSVAATLRG